jgi:hypothetical protein
MKQKLIISFLSSCLVLLASLASAQRATVSSDQAAGSFQISNGSPEAINVRYSLAPASPDNIVLLLVPGTEFTLNAHVMDAKGQEVLPIKPETVTGRYANSMDISKLAPGKYYVEVQTGIAGQEGHRIAFNVGTK